MFFSFFIEVWSLKTNIITLESAILTNTNLIKIDAFDIFDGMKTTNSRSL